MKYTTRTFAASMLSLAVALPGLAAADMTPEEEAIKYRQGIFTAMKWNVGRMGAMAKGKAPFDAKAFAHYAARLNALSDMHLEGFVPNSDKGDTTAKPEIWSKRAEYEKRTDDLKRESAKLVEVAKGGDEGAIKSQFAQATKTCKACHDDFRKKD